MSNVKSFFAYAILLCLTVPAGAADYAERWGASLHGEVTGPAGQHVVRKTASDAGLGLGGMAYYNLTQEWAAGLSYTNVDMSHGYRAEPIEVIAIRRFPLASDVAPYGRVGAGVSRGLDRKSYDHAATSLAIGVEKVVARDFAVGLEALWRYISDTGHSTLHAHSLGAGLNLTVFLPCAAAEEKPQIAKAPAPVDSDNDGVFDSADKCPGTPAGVKVDEQGCPIPLDSDGDGVLDSADKCPGTPAGVKVDEQGCAKAPEKVTIELNVLFDTAKADVKEEYYKEIGKVADFMKYFPETKAEIEGHTDDQGAADYNRSLSQQRADAVRQVLIDKFSLPADRLSAKGYGPDKPIADNGTEEGRRRNRRVVATLTATTP